MQPPGVAHPRTSGTSCVNDEAGLRWRGSPPDPDPGLRRLSGPGRSLAWYRSSWNHPRLRPQTCTSGGNYTVPVQLRDRTSGSSTSAILGKPVEAGDTWTPCPTGRFGGVRRVRGALTPTSRVAPSASPATCGRGSFHWCAPAPTNLIPLGRGGSRRVRPPTAWGGEMRKAPWSVPWPGPPAGVGLVPSAYRTYFFSFQLLRHASAASTVAHARECAYTQQGNAPRTLPSSCFPHESHSDGRPWRCAPCPDP